MFEILNSIVFLFKNDMKNSNLLSRIMTLMLLMILLFSSLCEDVQLPAGYALKVGDRKVSELKES